jgi:hypothetical protein
MKRFSPLSIAFVGLAAFVFIFLAYDNRFHWDEPAYLYTGAYLSLAEILEGSFQPSLIESFYTSRIFHILFIKMVAYIIGPGITSLKIIIIIYLMFLIGFTFLCYHIINSLLGVSDRLQLSIVIFSFTPLYLYFTFKTLPEVPSLFFSALAVWAFLKYLEKNALIHFLISIVALVFIVFLKNTMMLLYISFVLTLFLFKRDKYDGREIINKFLQCSVSSFIIFLILLRMMGISLRNYTAVFGIVHGETEPFLSTMLHVGLEGGFLFLALPLAFLNTQTKEAAFFAVWFILGTLPILLMTSSVEARYLAPNLVALAGLIHLSVSSFSSFLNDWSGIKKHILVAFISAFGVLTLLSTPLILRVMAYEVKFDDYRNLFSHLDRLYGHSNYATLLPWEYADFHFLRFVHPHKQLYTVHTRYENDDHKGNIEEDSRWKEFQEKYYGMRHIGSIDELAGVGPDLVYVGFNETPPVQNLRILVNKLSFLKLEKEFEKMAFTNHLETSWMWKHPRITFSEILHVGQYYAFKVELPTH